MLKINLNNANSTHFKLAPIAFELPTDCPSLLFVLFPSISLVSRVHVSAAHTSYQHLVYKVLQRGQDAPHGSAEEY